MENLGENEIKLMEDKIFILQKNLDSWIEEYQKIEKLLKLCVKCLFAVKGISNNIQLNVDDINYDSLDSFIKKNLNYFNFIYGK